MTGRTFTLNGVARTLVGVMPPRFAWGGAELWMPCGYEAAETRRSGQFDKYWGFVARLKPGVSVKEAAAGPFWPLAGYDSLDNRSDLGHDRGI